MNKVEYLDILKDYLMNSYSEAESLDILRDYEEYFLNGKLDGKTEEEIIGELGSPKKILENLKDEERGIQKKNGFFRDIIKKFDNWFENKLFNRYKHKNIEVVKSKFDNIFEKYGIFIFMFLAVFSILLPVFGIVFLHSFVPITTMFGIYIISMSFLVRVNKGVNSIEGKILTAINFFIMIFYFLFLLKVNRVYNALGVGVELSLIMAIINTILILIFSRGMFFIILISLIFAPILIILGLIWVFIVGITILGVASAIFLTPITLSILSVYEFSSLWIIFPIMLSIGLFIMMFILIKYYLIGIYKLILYYNNWIKMKFMYSRVYERKAKEAENEK